MVPWKLKDVYQWRMPDDGRGEGRAVGSRSVSVCFWATGSRTLSGTGPRGGR